MSDTGSAVSAADTSAASGGDSAALARIEQLLQEQAELNRKLLRSSRWRTVWMFVLVAAFVVFGVLFHNVLTTITQDIPQVISEADELVVTATSAVKTVVNKIDSLDIDSLNESIEGIASINYKGLNTSIGGLASSVESFEKFVDTLKNPGRAIGGLFGAGG